MRPFSRLSQLVRRGALVPLLATAALRADPVISEFLAINDTGLVDNDGRRSDWIEIRNPDPVPVNLEGWYLTDNAANKDKWKFPAVTIPPDGYLVVYASNQNRRDPAKPLHTNFVLEGSGEYLALVKPDGSTVASEFAPAFPEQFADISYGLTSPRTAGETARTGFFRTPTPGARNGDAASLLLLEKVTFSRAPGTFTGTITVSLAGAAAGQRIRYVLGAPAAAGTAVAEPTAASPAYTGPLTVSSSVVIRAAVFSDTDAQRGLSTSAQYVRLANSGTTRVDTFASQLPLLVIDTHGTGALEKESGEKPAWIYAWNRPSSGNTTLVTAPAVASRGSANVRGSSSSEFPKKSYTVRFTDANGEASPVGIFGLPPFSSWALIGPWAFDRTYLHNVFTYELSNRLGRWAPRTQLVEVFLNANGGNLDTADYLGLYILTDRLEVDPQRVKLTALETNDTGDKSITGGYLLKLDVPDADEFSFRTSRNYPPIPSQICLASPKAADLAPSQRSYIQGYIQALEDALHADQATGFQQRTHLDYIDRASWVDHHLLNVLTENVDAFFRSASFTKDRLGRMVAGSIWDNDRSMHGGDDRSQTPEEWNGGGGATDLWNFGWWGIIARDPDYLQAWIDRWQSLRATELATPALLALVDASAGKIGAAAAARDAARWPNDVAGQGNTPRFPGAWQGEVDNLKSWLTRRVAWIDTQFTARPIVTRAAGQVTLTPAPGTQLAYTLDGTDPRGASGRLSFAARVTSAPVTITETVDVQARGYQANVPPNRFPASAWSGPVGGPKSSALAPAVRLANLSSRGFVGAGENILIAGVAVNDTAGKTYLARAVGPALGAFGIGNALAAPILRIVDSAGREVARNAGWDSGNDGDEIADLAKSVGAFPFEKKSRDAALLTRLPYGQYTLQISSSTSATGVALAELYEADANTGRTVNLSTRGSVRAGEGLLIGGVVVSGPGPKRLLIRAVGPTLEMFGVGSTLPDPVLTLFSGSTVVARNDDWSATAANAPTGSEVASAASTVGAFALPAASRDSALLLTVAPGAYTVQVEGKANAEGVILFEIYEVP
ncbi:MAG: CotH kinase family protein [Verrucomicrobia bacterium]|nr:CotH kinase family protein [Verrucomicrobiota bacterium]